MIPPSISKLRNNTNFDLSRVFYGQFTGKQNWKAQLFWTLDPQKKNKPSTSAIATPEMFFETIVGGDRFFQG